MASTTVPAFLDALKAQLEARAGLTGATIATAPTAMDVMESVEFGHHIDGSQAWGSLGQRSRKEEYIVGGVVWVAKDGAGEAVAKEARDQVFDWFGELEAQLRSDPWVNQTVVGDTGAQITGGVLDQWPSDRQRIARILFQITCKAKL